MKKFKKLTPELVKKIEEEVKGMLHASRDIMRNRFIYDSIKNSNPKLVRYNYDELYGAAFGVMRCLHVMGYGYWGSNNLNAVRENRSDEPKHNLKWWFDELTQEVLNEENFGGSGICEHCFKKYGKDDSGRSAIIEMATAK